MVVNIQCLQYVLYTTLTTNNLGYVQIKGIETAIPRPQEFYRDRSIRVWNSWLRHYFCIIYKIWDGL